MWYWILAKISNIVLRLLFDLKIKGLENLPKKTNFILASNHASFLDPVVIGATIPKKIYWITMREIYNSGLLKWVALHKEALPTGNSCNRAARLLIKNKNVGLFPEGTRSHDGNLGEFRRGAALLALRTGRPVVPCAILGAYEAFPRMAGFPKFSPITLKIGRPQYLLKEHDEVVDDIILQEGTLRIRNAVKEMLNAG
ncbi:MAG: 1-acyl-sn-glycerol-3-phosphate acyltransferase [Candidatus Omnitrophica bacterium]|nr:1-acyl-sn-glycerol-3-phosphate acyltransferase [Candidatus Omnitrophota bacterium]